MDFYRTAVATALLSSLCLIVPTLGLAQDMQTQWTTLPTITSSVTPAISDHPDAADGDLYVATVAFSGLVAVSHTGAPAGWTAWEILGPPSCFPQPCVDPAFYAEPNTPARFVKHGNTLYLFARGSDDNLYLIRKPGTGAWDAGWQQLTFDGQVRGRISVAVTQPTGGGTPEFGAVYAAPNTSVEFRQFDAAGSPNGVPWKWPNAIEATLGTDGENQLVAVIRTVNRWLQVDTKIRPWETGWQPLVTIYTGGVLGAFHDISNVAFHAEAYHVAYAYEYLCDDVSQTYCNAVAVANVPLNASYTRVQQVTGYVPSGGIHPLSTLAVYRNKLVLGTTGVDGWVRSSHWDTADPTTPWIGDTLVSTSRQTSGRPALAAQDHRVYSTYPHAVPSFGNDLFSAAVDPSGAVQFINFSRAALMLEMDQQVSLWDSLERTDGNLCQGDSGDATLMADPFTDGRLVMSEIGFNLWALPNWLSSHFAGDAAEQGCLAGNPSGRFPAPCSTTRYPVIVRPGGGIFVCDGIWINQGNNYYGVWEEFGHTLAGGTLGFDDNNGVPPDAAYAARSGIALADLITGYNLFGEQVNGGRACNLGSDPVGPNAGRCRGFTGTGGNYDVGSRQHSFIYAAADYFSDADQLRDWIDRDLAVGVDLLQRKYDWIRTHIFQGIEFREENEPLDLWNVDCLPSVPLTCGSTYTFSTAGQPNDVEGYFCNGFAYTGPEVGHVLLTPEDALVDVTVSGLSDDLDLLLMNNAGPGCDSLGCTLGSTAGGTTSEFLQFNATVGQPYYLVVDGYNGAQSGYTISVTCRGASPGAVPLSTGQLQVYHNADGVSLDLSWGASCAMGGSDYEVYEGTLGNWYYHAPVSCTTFGGTTFNETPAAGDRYFLVVPSNRLNEGSYGTGWFGLERPAGAPACLPVASPSSCP